MLCTWLGQALQREELLWRCCAPGWGRLYSSDTGAQIRTVLSTELANGITSTVACCASIGSSDKLGTNAVFNYLISLAFSASSSLLHAFDQNARMRWWPSQGGLSAPRLAAACPPPLMAWGCWPPLQHPLDRCRQPLCEPGDHCAHPQGDSWGLCQLSALWHCESGRLCVWLC